MSKIKNILFPVDFSERACGGAPFVAAFMKRFGAKATVLHMVEPMPYVVYADGAPVVLNLDTLREEAQAHLNESFLREFANLPATRLAAVGNAADSIIRFANTNKVDLIMMPTHGYGLFRSFLLGSVTSKVLHDAQCPVWTATHTEEPPLKEHLPCKSVLCAVDGSDNSLSVLRWAGEFARNAEAKLRVVHVIPAPGEWMSRSLAVEFEMESRRQARIDMETLESAAGLEAPICIAAGDVSTGICGEATQHGADVVIIGRGILHERLGRLRAHSYQIIRTAPCPVISV
jgi:nucleotide-binding universal stress UspA family protein